MISADLVKKLRDATGAPMMDCKKALAASDGDLEASKDWLRKNGIASALKKRDREATEGVIGIVCKGGYGIALELSSETDFVARSSDFQELATQMLQLAIDKRPETIDALLELPCAGGTLKEQTLAVGGKLGENIMPRRLVSLSVSPGEVIGYVHSPIGPSLGAIGVLVALESSAQGLSDIGKKIAMHVAASAPRYVHMQEVPEDVIAREKEVLSEQAKKEGRPEAVIQKMIEGRLKKFFEEMVLEEQPFIFEPDKKVKDILKEQEKVLGARVKVVSIVRLMLGEVA